MSYIRASQATHTVKFEQHLPCGLISMDQMDFRRELEQMHPASFGWALWCCDHRREDAEEILQMAYVKVLEATARFDGRSSLRTWFFAVIRRTAWEHRRRRWVRELLLGQWTARQPAFIAETTPDAVLAVSEESHALRQALTALPVRQREVLHLVFYQEMTIEQSATVLNISLGTARTHFERGKKKLREILNRDER